MTQIERECRREISNAFADWIWFDAPRDAELDFGQLMDFLVAFDATWMVSVAEQQASEGGWSPND